MDASGAELESDAVTAGDTLRRQGEQSSEPMRPPEYPGGRHSINHFNRSSLLLLGSIACYGALTVGGFGGASPIFSVDAATSSTYLHAGEGSGFTPPEYQPPIHTLSRV